MFNKLIKYLARYEIQSAYSRGISDANAIEIQIRKDRELEELNQFIGKKVILFSNEWEDMIFAEGLRVEPITQSAQPVLVVKDVLTDEEYLTFSMILPYSREMAHALLKLNPFERWNIRARNTGTFWDKKIKGDLSDPEAVIEALKVIDFY